MARQARLWPVATDVKVREGGHITHRAVIGAVAVNEEGKREVLGVHAGPSEVQARTAFLRVAATKAALLMRRKPSPPNNVP